jgi:hypothetical protein
MKLEQPVLRTGLMILRNAFQPSQAKMGRPDTVSSTRDIPAESLDAINSFFLRNLSFDLLINVPLLFPFFQPSQAKMGRPDTVSSTRDIPAESLDAINSFFRNLSVDLLINVQGYKMVRGRAQPHMAPYI